MEDIRILHQFEESNKLFIITEGTKKFCKYPNCGKFSDKVHSKILEKYLMDY